MGARDNRRQLRKHLATVTNAQTKAVTAGKKRLKLSQQLVVEQDASGPSNARTERVAVTEATAGHQTVEVCQISAAGLQVTHMDVDGFKSAQVNTGSHFDVRVHALLSEHSHAGSRGCCAFSVPDKRRHREWHMPLHSRIVGIAEMGVLLIGAFGVVTQTAHLPANAVPHGVQVGQRSIKNRLRVPPHLDTSFASRHGRGVRTGLTDHMAASAQSMAPKGGQCLVTLRCLHLNNSTQFFIEKRFQRPLLAACVNLRRPVFAVANVHSAVTDPVALKQKHVNVQCDADVASKRHFANGRHQAAITAVVVGQQHASAAKFVDGIDQCNQILGVV